MIKFPGRKPITDMGHDYGALTFTDVIVKSSNVGAIKIGLKVGAERMGLYVRAIRLRPSDRRRISLARAPASSGTRRR